MMHLIISTVHGAKPLTVTGETNMKTAKRIIDKTLSDKEIHLLEHMLGADSRYAKKKWGWRNYFYLSHRTGESYEALKSLQERGFLQANAPRFNSDGGCFYATEYGCRAIGLHKAAIKRALST